MAEGLGARNKRRGGPSCECQLREILPPDAADVRHFEAQRIDDTLAEFG